MIGVIFEAGDVTLVEHLVFFWFGLPLSCYCCSFIYW